MTRPVQTARTTSDSDMGDTMLPRHRRRYSALRPRVHTAFVRAAPECGVTAGSLAQHTGIYVARIAYLVNAAAAIPDPSFIERTLAPIDAARAGVVAARLTPELIQRAQASDAAEEVAEARYCTTGTLPALRAWIHALETQRGDSLALLMALKAEVARA